MQVVAPFHELRHAGEIIRSGLGDDPAEYVKAKAASRVSLRHEALWDRTLGLCAEGQPGPHGTGFVPYGATAPAYLKREEAHSNSWCARHDQRNKAKQNTPTTSIQTANGGMRVVCAQQLIA